MARKIVSMLLCCAMLLSLTVSAQAEFVIRGSQATAGAGEEVTVEIALENNPGISALNLYYIYDKDILTLTQVENKVSAFTMTNDVTTVWDAASNYTQDGTLATLTFEVAENAPAGDYEIQLYFISAANDEFEAVQAATVSATVTVKSNSATAQPTITLKYPTLSFKDEILLNVYFEAVNLENVVDMGLITYGSEVDSWNIHNAEKVIPGYRFSEAKGLYVVTTEGIPAKNMVDTLWFAIYAELSDGSYYYTKLVYYSPKMYADSLMGTQGKDLDALLVSMLNYGAAAQTYFGYRTDELINKDLTAQQQASVSAYSSDMINAAVTVPAGKQGTFASTGGYTERYPSVSFKGAFAINYYCVPQVTPVDGITLYYWDEATYATNAVLTPENASGVLEMSTNASGRYAGSVKGIPARMVSSVVYVAFRYSDGTTTYNSGILPYSIGEYCGYYAGIQHEFTPMAQATAVYGYYAKQYFC